ncbi:hypothetical protein GLYMA_10G192100v4 [Glycine max]|nr:hypothetical protein GLYMA_10G192100v4 [Glycine max]KAH1139027.1 hypothetical protein GYH30_028471 [Glycine max]
MDDERETLDEPVEKEGSLVGDGKDLKVGVLGSDLCTEDGVCTREGDAELNGDVGFDGSKEEGKGVNPSGGEAAEALGEGSQVVRSLEGKSENEIAELDGNDATLKTLDEKKNINDRKVKKLVEKEAISDVIRVKSDVSQSIEEHAKAQLLAFYRLKGYSCLPELQYCGVVDNDTDAFLIKDLLKGTDKSLSKVNKHATHASKKGQTGAGNLKTTNGSCRKSKHNLKDDLYPEKKKRILSESVGRTPDSSHGYYRSGDATDNLISPASSKKRKTIDHCAAVSGVKDRRKTISLAKVSNSIKQSFKIGERILRVANQLTGPPSVLKCSGDRSQMEDGSADGFSGNGSGFFSPNLEKTQKSSLTVPTEYSSLDDLLHLLQWVAQEPLGDYSSLNVIVSFFSDFRNSIIVANDSGKEISPTKKVGKKKKRPVGGSPETIEFDDLSDTHWTDKGIQSGSEKKLPRRSNRRDYQHAPAEPEKPIIVYTRRSYSRKQCSDSNLVVVPEKPFVCADENSPAELVLNFAELDSVPSEMHLNKIFRRFGPLNESETEVDRGSSRARVVFKKCTDAEVAFSNAKNFNIFGSVLVNYKLNHTPSTLFKASSLATTQDQENGDAC